MIDAIDVAGTYCNRGKPAGTRFTGYHDDMGKPALAVANLKNRDCEPFGILQSPFRSTLEPLQKRLDLSFRKDLAVRV